MPEVCQSTSEVRIQVFTINAKNLDCWNHPNMLSLKNRMGGGERKPKKKSGFLCLKSTKSKIETTFFSQHVRNKNRIFFCLEHFFRFCVVFDKN